MNCSAHFAIYCTRIQPEKEEDAMSAVAHINDVATITASRHVVIGGTVEERLPAEHDVTATALHDLQTVLDH